MKMKAKEKRGNKKVRFADGESDEDDIVDSSDEEEESNSEGEEESKEGEEEVEKEEDVNQTIKEI